MKSQTKTARVNNPSGIQNAPSANMTPSLFFISSVCFRGSRGKIPTIETPVAEKSHPLTKTIRVLLRCVRQLSNITHSLHSLYFSFPLSFANWCNIVCSRKPLSAMSLMSAFLFPLKHRLIDATSPDPGLYSTRGPAVGAVFDIVWGFLTTYVHNSFGMALVDEIHKISKVSKSALLGFRSFMHASLPPVSRPPTKGKEQKIVPNRQTWIHYQVSQLRTLAGLKSASPSHSSLLIR
jgi:hypothetical protein